MCVIKKISKINFSKNINKKINLKVKITLDTKNVNFCINYWNLNLSFYDNFFQFLSIIEKKR